MLFRSGGAASAEIKEWQRTGQPQLISADAAPPPPSAAAAGEEPVTGRTAVSSPSRVLPPPPKAATAPGIPIAQAAKPTAAPAPQPKPASNFTLGTQVSGAIGSGDSQPQQAIAQPPPQAITPAAAPPTRAAAAPPPPPAVKQPAAASSQSAATLPTLPQFTLGSQVGGALDQPSTLATSMPAMPSLTANIPMAPQALPQGTPQALPQMTRAPEAAQPTPLPQLQPPPQQLAQNLPLLPQASAPAMPAAQPQYQPQRPTQQTAQLPQPVETLGPPRGAPTATTTRRPPWMSAGAQDPVALGPPLPGNTPPPLPPTPMASVPPSMMPPAAPAQAQAELSPAEASRQYIAAREAGTLYPPPQQMAALPSYRALQPASPYPPPQAQAQYAPPAAPQMPPYATAQAALPLPATPVAMPGGGAYAAGGPEALFRQGYQLEMSGRFREAEMAYEQVMVNYPNSQTAMLANERLNGLRRFTRETGVRVAGQPGAERQSQVVAVNEPRLMPGHGQPSQAYAPAPAFSVGGTGAGAIAGEEGGGMVQNLTNMNVCTQKGLYDKEARWCGIVRADDGKRLAVEVRDVVLPRFGSWSIDASTCTGGTSINWFSKGSMVRVPRACMEIKG